MIWIMCLSVYFHKMPKYVVSGNMPLVHEWNESMSFYVNVGKSYNVITVLFSSFDRSIPTKTDSLLLTFLALQAKYTFSPWNQFKSLNWHRRPHIWNSSTSSASHHRTRDNLINLPMDEMAAISQNDIFKCIFLNKKFVFWFEFHWSLFLWVQLTITQHWFR